MPSPPFKATVPVASNSSSIPKTIPDVVQICKSVSDESSTSAYDSTLEQAEGADTANELEQYQHSVLSEPDVCEKGEVEPEEAGEAETEETEILKNEELETDKKEASVTANVDLNKKSFACVIQDEIEPKTHSCKSDQQEQEQKKPIPLTHRPGSRSAQSSRPFVPLASKSWRVRAMQSNTQITRLMKAALLQTLLHAIRTGSVEGVKVAIERGVQVLYLDSRQRNLVMLATKCDTESRLRIVIILLDAGCDMNHKDQLGWSCLHYACASGANDVAAELIRRGASVEFNPYGYGPEDFNIPKVARAKSLLQHTEQLQHEQNVFAAWTYFRRQAERDGYSVKCKPNCNLGKPLKITFQAPVGHSPLDRIRVVDMNSDVALWLQVSKTFNIPPGDVGTITLDVETLDRPSLYRIVYEKYEPTPIQLPATVAESNLCVKNLDTGTTVSVGSVNTLVLKELESSRLARKSTRLSSSARPAPKSDKVNKVMRRGSTTRAREIAEGVCESSVAEDEETEFSVEETITTQPVAEHPAVTSITGVYRIVAMGAVSVSTLKTAKANEYEITINRKGPLGLQLAPKIESLKQSPRLIVSRSRGQSAAVNPGDCLVAIGNANIEHAGLKHTLWALNDAKRPLVLRFRRGNAKEKRSLFKTGLSKITGPRSIDKYYEISAQS
ncbi:FOG: Ankyrin repeat [Plasmopara halstedii]|uniref:FOG: Ankyrin repeat n=1 Tax=Plasmopara halstedii TaxID=4781 RepID=A0A0P1AYE3_PLAHL|nr:FOG: Ankyrin repeat [Plasmopara halstedii]CEG47487.1 FOG: Ankyrin repeat [Plasmopara halstedii]|eukprot:XP_024583856.1 FOG: Ankyrin repeat [Plasmopara halstedii]